MFGRSDWWMVVVFLLLVGAVGHYVLTLLYSWVGGGLTGWLAVALCVCLVAFIAVIYDR